MNRDPSRPNPKKRKHSPPQQGKMPTGKHAPGTPHPYRRPKKDRRKGRGEPMTKQTKQQKRRTTPRQPTTRTVYEVARRQDGRASRPTLLEARGAGDLAPQLVDALGLDEATGKAAALLLDQGATITAQGWQGRAVGQMQFTPLVPSSGAQEAQEGAGESGSSTEAAPTPQEAQGAAEGDVSAQQATEHARAGHSIQGDTPDAGISAQGQEGRQGY